MHSIYTDFNKINNMDGKLYLGIKLLHIFFFINLASKFDFKLKIPNNSSLNDLFLLTPFFKYLKSIIVLSVEQFLSQVLRQALPIPY